MRLFISLGALTDETLSFPIGCWESPPPKEKARLRAADYGLGGRLTLSLCSFRRALSSSCLAISFTLMLRSLADILRFWISDFHSPALTSDAFYCASSNTFLSWITYLSNLRFMNLNFCPVWFKYLVEVMCIEGKGGRLYPDLSGVISVCVGEWFYIT